MTPAAVLVAVLLLAGCSGKSAPAPVPVPLPSLSVAPPNVDHIVVIVEENKPSGSILGSAEAPYLNRLARDYALARSYTAITHPSLPNYVALTSGTTAGITTDCHPDECSAGVASIADRVEASGRTWKIYAEGMPAPCGTSDAGAYATKHVPFLYYPNIRDNAARCAATVVPFTRFESDLASGRLPDLSVITPDLCNDMHDCSIGTGDAWLAERVPKILGSTAFAGNSLLVITFDEGRGSDNSVVTVFAGPAARRGVGSSVAYTHYSLLRTIGAVWGLDPLTGNDAGAPVMSDLLRTAGNG